MSKTLGEMTPAERRAAVSRALGKLQAELTAAAPHIARILDAADAEDRQDQLALDRMDDDGFGCAITAGPDTDQLADDITAELVALCATRADLARAELVIIRTNCL